MKPVLGPLRSKSIKPCFKDESIKIFSDTSLISKVPQEYKNLLKVGLVKSIFSSIYLLQQVLFLLLYIFLVSFNGQRHLLMV